MAPTLDPKASSPTAEELFDGLTISDQKPSRPPANRPPGPPGPGRRGPPPPNHRPTRSQEEAMRQRRMQGNASVSSGPPRPPGPAGSPPRRPQERRPRRNSDSSLLIDIEKPLTDEEKKAKEARRRERERRAKEGKGPKKPSKRIDVIDQLDATSIYGTGLFHHDGPFDAVNPHRNRQGSRRAPMQAFAKDSLNMSLGGSGPLNKRPDHATFMGNNDGDASADFAGAGKNQFLSERKDEPAVFDPRSRGSVLHGEESLGLGTSTFLEGTPAARTAIQRRQAEEAQQVATEGLKRNKSIAQRIRGMKREPREYGPPGRMTNPEGAYHSRRSPDSAGPSSSVSYSNERNPFFSEYSKGEESISVRRTDNKVRSPGSPPAVPGRSNGLERRATADLMSPTEDSSSKPSGGFLARVKSLKGGRRRQVSDAMAPPAPGTAA